MGSNLNNFRILKLKSGENIICNVRTDLTDKFLVDYPFDMETMVLVDRFGIPRQEKLILKRWLNYCKGHSITVPKDYIVGITHPTEALLNHYLQVRKGNNHIAKLSPEEENHMREAAEEANEAMKEMLKDYFENGVPEEMLEQIASNINDEYFMEMEDDDVEEEVEDDESEDDMGWGTKYTDWSPDPNDYI